MPFTCAQMRRGGDASLFARKPWQLDFPHQRMRLAEQLPLFNKKPPLQLGEQGRHIAQMGAQGPEQVHGRGFGQDREVPQEFACCVGQAFLRALEQAALNAVGQTPQGQPFRNGPRRPYELLQRIEAHETAQQPKRPRIPTEALGDFRVTARWDHFGSIRGTQCLDHDAHYVARIIGRLEDCRVKGLAPHLVDIPVLH